MLSQFEKSKALSLVKIREHRRLYDLKQSRKRIMERNGIFRAELMTYVWGDGDTPMSRYYEAKKKEDRMIARLSKKSRDLNERKRKMDLIEQINVKRATLIQLMSIPGITVGEKQDLLSQLRAWEKKIPKFYFPNGACETCIRKPCECYLKPRFRSKYPYFTKTEARLYLLFTLGCYMRERRLKSAVLIQKVARGRQDRFYVEYLLKTRRKQRAKLLRRSLRKEISRRSERSRVLKSKFFKLLK